MFNAVLVCCNARSDDVTHQIIHDNSPIVRLHSAHKSHIPPAENEPSCNTLGNQIYRRGKMNRVAPASRKIGVTRVLLEIDAVVNLINGLQFHAEGAMKAQIIKDIAEEK